MEWKIRNENDSTIKRKFIKQWNLLSLTKRYQKWTNVMLSFSIKKASQIFNV